MRSSSRIVVNTLVQYVRTIINMLLSLYSSRLVLDILGVDDFGIYVLVAGVVSMLSFVTNSLMGSTQRFLSFHKGKGDVENLKNIFNNSLILHIFLGLCVTVLLEVFSLFLFDNMLNVPLNRIGAAKVLYQFVVWMVYIAFIASPFRALLIAHENIVYTSIMDVLDGILKVLLVVMMSLISGDKLLIYGVIMLCIQVFNLLTYSTYCYFKYEECIIPRLSKFNFKYVKELSVYTGWMIYSTLVVTGKNQGVALVLNRFFNVATNAAYGIGGQISGMLSYVSQSFYSAISPQLMAAEGAGCRQRMLMLAEVQSKFSFLLLAMLAIPSMFEMGALLSFWLGTVPNHGVMFACAFLSMQTLDQLSQGLGQANRAIGNIGKYTLVTYSPKLVIIPLAWGLFSLGKSLLYVMTAMILIEYLCMLLRIWLFRNIEGFQIWDYCHNVLVITNIPVVFSIAICYIIVCFIDVPWRFILTYAISISIFVLSSYTLALKSSEREMIKGVIKRIKNRG